MEGIIQPCNFEHIKDYGKIYAAAFSGEPWNDAWTHENAEIHVREILESKQSYGIEYILNGKPVAFLLGCSMLFHFGRMFEINDFAVHPDYQGKGIASLLLEKCISEMKQRDIKAINLITANEGFLPDFYQKHYFEKENEVILMSLKL